MSDALIVVLDVGKTNVKLVAHDRTGRRVHARSTPNATLKGPSYDRVDVDGIWTFLLDGLREIARGAPVSDIIATTHGCAFACLDRAALGANEPGDGLALPVMDYEWGGVRAQDAAYDPIRPPFTETGSPALPVGLNGGRQLHCLMREHSAAFERVGAIVPLPQYFAWRLSGGLAADPSSLGCHSDLWVPVEGQHSTLAHRFGWDRLLGPVRAADDVLGTVHPALAQGLGLKGETQVRVGVHDSNASLAPHLDGMGAFTLISSGTWAIAFAVGADLGQLDEARDCLLNVDVRGRPVPSARFMAGRERAILLGDAGDTSVVPPNELAALVARVLEMDAVPKPSFVHGSGPFPDDVGTLPENWPMLSGAERGVAASLYVAQVLTAMLDLVRTDGPILIDGPLATDRIVVGMLAGKTAQDVRTVDVDAASGAAYLIHRQAPMHERTNTIPSFRDATRRG